MEYYQRSSYRSTGNNKYRKKPSDGFPHLFLFYILPFLVFNTILFICVTSRPKFTVEIEDTKDYLSTQATIAIESWFPTKSITFNMDGEELEATKGKKRTYSIPINRNGVLEVTIVNLNGMSSTSFRHINILDDVPPSFENAALEDSILTLRISDSQSSVNPDSIYAIDTHNQVQYPASINIIENSADGSRGYELTFEMNNDGLQVFVQDMAGNESRKSFTTHKEGNLDVLEVTAEEETPENAEDINPETAPLPEPSETNPQTEAAQASQIVIE